MLKKTIEINLICITVMILLTGLNCSEDTSVDEPPVVDPNTTIIDLGSNLQIIRGFGGVNMPGWINDMTAAQLNTAFGTGTGQIGLSILRIRVPYDSSKFELEVPAAKLAHSLGAVIIASPWTPPAWMKSNNSIIGGTLNLSAYSYYAAHLKSFADYMSAEGVPLYALSLQNEPDVNVNYESCRWSASQFIKFLIENAPSIGSNIIVPEISDFNHNISDAILNDVAASSNVFIIGGHIYGGGIESYPLAVNKGKEVWMTEHLDLDTTWNGALGTAIEINDCMNAGMQAYLWWYIRRFYGPINDDGQVTKRGYVISQYARFVRPGSVMVKTSTNPQDYVYATSYKYGSETVIVAVNDNFGPVNHTFILQNGSVSNFSQYITSYYKNCSADSGIQAVNNSFSVTLDSLSVTTFISE